MHAISRLTALVFVAATTMSAHAANETAPRLRDRLPETPETRDRAKPPSSDLDVTAPEGEASQAGGVHASVIKVQGFVPDDASALRKIFDGYIARDLGRSELAALAKEVTAAYRAMGYPLARATIPTQSISNGVLWIAVDGGRVQSVKFEGDGHDLTGFFEPLLHEPILRRSALNRALTLIGDVPGISVEGSRFEADKSRRGVFDLIVRIKRKSASGQLFLDDRGESGAVQLGAQAAINDIAGTGAQLRLETFVDLYDPSRKRFGELTLALPVGWQGTVVNLSASGASTVDGDLGVDRYRSDSAEMVLSISHPAIRTQDLSLWLNASVERSHEDSTMNGTAVAKDDLVMARAGLSLNARDGWGGRNRASVEVTWGRDRFDGVLRPPATPGPDDRASFAKVNLSASRIQQISPAWSLSLALKAQVSPDDLPDPERIAFGGAAIGRAYDYSEIVGDSGLAGQAELRFDRTLNGVVQGIQAYAFGDAAAVWIRDGEGEPDTIASAGVGLRASLRQGLRATAEISVPVNRTSSDRDTQFPRFFATLSRSF